MKTPDFLFAVICLIVFFLFLRKMVVIISTMSVVKKYSLTKTSMSYKVVCGSLWIVFLTNLTNRQKLYNKKNDNSNYMKDIYI